MGVLETLGVIFITLKLLGITTVATWSWLAVTAPLWGGLGLTLSVVLCGGWFMRKLR